MADKKGNSRRSALKFFAAIAILFYFTSNSPAQGRLCDTAFEDCRAPLWNLINAETDAIDVAFWFMQDSSYATLLINKKNAGVRIRVICDPRSSPTYPRSQQVLDQLQAAGIPMRYKLSDCILHNKVMIFNSQ